MFKNNSKYSVAQSRESSFITLANYNLILSAYFAARRSHFFFNSRTLTGCYYINNIYNMPYKYEWMWSIYHIYMHAESTQMLAQWYVSILFQLADRQSVLRFAFWQLPERWPRGYNDLCHLASVIHRLVFICSATTENYGNVGEMRSAFSENGVRTYKRCMHRV